MVILNKFLSITLQSTLLRLKEKKIKEKQKNNKSLRRYCAHNDDNEVWMRKLVKYHRTSSVCVESLACNLIKITFVARERGEGSKKTIFFYVTGLVAFFLACFLHPGKLSNLFSYLFSSLCVLLLYVFCFFFHFFVFWYDSY